SRRKSKCIHRSTAGACRTCRSSPAASRSTTSRTPRRRGRSSSRCTRPGSCDSRSSRHPSGSRARSRGERPRGRRPPPGGTIVAAASLPQGGIRLGVGEGQAYWLLTDLFTFKVLGEDTNGAYSVAEVDAGPELGPPPHVHRDADESFYILEGTFDFSLAGAAF